MFFAMWLCSSSHTKKSLRRETSHPNVSELRGFLGQETLSAKPRKTMGKPRWVSHPKSTPTFESELALWLLWPIECSGIDLKRHVHFSPFSESWHCHMNKHRSVLHEETRGPITLVTPAASQPTNHQPCDRSHSRQASFQRTTQPARDTRASFCKIR